MSRKKIESSIVWIDRNFTIHLKKNKHSHTATAKNIRDSNLDFFQDRF